MGVVTRASDHALWNSVVETLRSTVLPHVDEPHAALQTRRLIGLAMYARDRGADPTDARAAAVTELIGDGDPTAVLLDRADPRRALLQALLVEHLDADLASERVLLEHFGEQSAPAAGLDDASHDRTPGWSGGWSDEGTGGSGNGSGNGSGSGTVGSGDDA